ncbi:MAG: hypothetical protein ACJAY8_000717 [Sphingobacteriales bacterium]|jgi:hypothetical protein
MRTCFFLLIIAMTVGCKQTGEIRIEQKHLPDSTFVKLTAELLILEGVHTQTFRRPDVPTEIYGAFAGAFQRHGITPEQWKENLEYYMLNPQEMQKMYADVVIYLPTLKQQYRDSLSLIPGDQPVPDRIVEMANKMTKVKAGK